MSDTTPNLVLPYIMPAQAQKHVTHNEAIRALDAVVHLAVIDRHLATPPAGAPANGDRYIVGASPTGAWAGHDGEVAAYQDGAWMFYAPELGWLAWIADEAKLVVWNGSAWIVAGGSDTALNPASGGRVGVNATADATNRLALASPASLFNHEGAGHQQKINKAAPADTASVLYQTGFSGRAEMGLAGDDDFHFKVSPDGAVWHEALVIDRTNGRVSLPATPAREVLAAGRTYHVSPAGNDANDGLSSGTALATINAAIAKCHQIDPNGYGVSIQLADGTYSAGSAPLNMTGPLLGGTRLTINGNAAAPENVVLRCWGWHTAIIQNGAAVQLQHLELQNTGSGSLLNGLTGADIRMSNLRFTASTRYQIELDGLVALNIVGDYSILGGANRHLYLTRGASVTGSNRTATLIGMPNFSGSFILVTVGGLYQAWNQTWSGAATGTRYHAALNGVIYTFGAGANHFPGDAAGTTATGGQYA